VCVDLSKVCIFFYGFHWFHGLYVFFACFSSSGFQRVGALSYVSPPGFTAAVLMRAMGMWVFGFGWWGFEGRVCEL